MPHRISPLVLALGLAASGLSGCGGSGAAASATTTVTAPAVTHTVIAPTDDERPASASTTAGSPTTAVSPSTSATSTTPPAAGTTSSAAPTSAPASTPAPAAGVTEAGFDAAAAAYLKGRKGHVGVFAVDLTDGRQVQHNAGQRCETASMVKLDVLLTLLLQRQDAGKPLSSSDRALTSSMIINSDNNATTTLWGRIGQHEGVRAANRRFGMTETEPGTSYRWGLTTTTAADQVRLLRNLVRDDGPLDQASRDYALGLMGRVADGQDWGVSAANPQHEAQVKNGWLPRSDGWVVTSAGRAQTAAGHEVLLAAVSCEVSSQQHGIETIEHLAEMAASALDR
ncbi:MULTISPECIES: serine hydrolase [Arsenicicoccus]|uniref:serine hydrolase n=1 Tax=Arsenicicoccus TaxID=267408 RepID=UPI000400325E|nr:MULTISPECIES: serine hydrolase [Arsenicicoccus]